MHLLARGIGAALLCLIALYARADSPAPAQDDPIASLSRSLAAAEQRLGTAHPSLIAILGPLAQLRFQAADIAEATALRRRSLKIAIDAFGSDSVPAAEAMAALASLDIELQRYLDAEPLLITAGNVLTAHLGAEDPAMAPVLAGRARIALARGDNSCARKWAEQAVALDEKSEPEQRSLPLRTLGAVLAAGERFDESERIFRQALALDRRTAGEDGLATARSLAQLANVFVRWKRFADALPLIEEATRIDQSRLGATHPRIADDLHDLGQVYLATERTADARTVFRAAVDLLDRGAGRGTPRVAYLELALARADHQLGRAQEADSLFANARRLLNAAEDEERDRERRI